MTIYSANEIKALREIQHIDQMKVVIVVPPTLWSGRVNGSPDRGARSISYDTGSGTGVSFIRSFQELWVGTKAGDYDVGRVRIKTFSGTTTGTITLDENGLVWQDNLYLTIRHYYPIVGIQPRIASQVFYKFYDVAYSNQNEKSTPVNISGPDRLAFLTGSDVTVDFDVSDSYPTASGAAISSYALSVAPTAGTTVTFNTGTGIGDVEFTATGTYWVTTTVTDDNAKSQERFVLVEVIEQPYLDAQIGSWSEAWPRGVEATVNVSGDIGLDKVPEDTIIFLWDEARWTVTSIFDDVDSSLDQMVLIGYVRSETGSRNFTDGTRQVTLNIASIDGILDNLPMRSVGLKAVSGPNKWWQYTFSLTVGRAVHHLFKWHTSVMERHDIIGLLDNTQADIKVDFEEGAIFGSVNQVAFDKGIFYQLTCDRLNRIHFCPDSQRLNSTGRNALDTVMNIELEDLASGASWNHNEEPRAFTCQLSGFYYSGSGANTPYVSLIPGYRESSYSHSLPGPRGSQLIDKQYQLVTSQTDCNEKCGREFALANLDIVEVRLTFRGNYLLALSTVPKYGWWKYLVTDERVIDLYDRRMVCRSIQAGFNAEVGRLEITAVFQPEAIGPNAVQGNYPTGMPTPPPPPDPPWEIDEGGLGALLSVGSGWYRDDNATDWLELESFFTYQHGCIDPFWQARQGTSDPLSMIWWAVTIGGIHRFVDVGAAFEDVTMSNDPPNTWSAGTAPIVAQQTFWQIEGTYWHSDSFYALAGYKDGTDWRGWLAVTVDNGFSWSWISLYDTVGSLPDQIRPLWMANNGTYLLIAIWEEGNASGTEQFKLLVFDADTLVYDTEYTMGVVTQAEMEAETYKIFPVIVYDDDDLWYVAGRLNAPQALAAPEHIIETDDAGISWSSFEKTWSADVCMALKIGLDSGGDREFYAVRGTL